jgi:hypothetical protein
MGAPYNMEGLDVGARYKIRWRITGMEAKTPNLLGTI